MKKEHTRRIVFWILSLVVLVMAVLFSLVSFERFKQDNKNTIESIDSEYVKEFTLSLALKLDEKFANAQTSVTAVADMVGSDLIGEDDICSMLATLEDETEFDHVRYVDATGTSHTSEGKTADVSDRTYFTEGMKGNSGSTYITNSRLTDQKQIGFYAPVINDEGVCGVIVAFFDGDSLVQSIDYDFYGEKASAGIVTKDGETITYSFSDSFAALLDDPTLDACDLIDEPLFAGNASGIIQNAYVNQSESYFSLANGKSEIAGYIAPLSYSELSLFVIFPQEAAEKLYEGSISAGEKLQSSLMAIFVSLILLIAVSFALKFFSMKKENTSLDQMANTDRLTGLGNRRAYEEKILFYESGKLPDSFVYISADVNGLKQINDSMGHLAGDELIRGAAECLKKGLEAYGEIYRIGGDEFAAVLFIERKDIEGLIDEARSIISAWEGSLVKELSISFGYVSMADDRSRSLRDIIDAADKMMYRDKANFYKKNTALDRRKR